MLLRILAFYTAKSNFTHKVSFKKKESHELVTNGIYSVFRHPSYTGFFYYTIASMLLIGNWVSAFLFAMMLSYFFDDRIEYEEHYLLRFFGDKYENYRNQTYVLIPVLPQWVKDKLPNFNGWSHSACFMFAFVNWWVTPFSKGHLNFKVIIFEKSFY